MQYGVDISSYKRVEKNNRKNESKVRNINMDTIMAIFIGFLLSRVMLSLTMEMGIAPFGIAYLVGLKKKNFNYKLLSLIGVMLGYISIYGVLEGSTAYCIASVGVIVYIELCDRIDIKKRDYISFFIIFSIFIIYNVLVNNQPIGVNIIFSLLKIITIIPVKYMINYSISSIDELKSNYFFSTEEIISIGILICLLIAGIGDMYIYNIYIRNVMGLCVVALFGYIGGPGIGASIGVAMGFVIGMTSNDILILVTLYSLCGMMIGIFREVGKIFSCLSYLVVYFILWMYAKEFNIYFGIEVLIAMILFSLTPKKLIEYMSIEFNKEKKSEIINEAHLTGIKDEFIGRLNSMKSILNTLSVSIVNLGENDILSLNNKGTAMVENLADRVCYNCELRQRCWDRNLHSTFGNFSELISGCEKNDIYLPKDLEKKCVKTRSLMKSAQEIVNNYTVNEALKTRLTEGRNIIANHINNISKTMGNMISDFEKDVVICSEIDKILRKAFNKNNIEYIDVFTFLDRKGRMKIKITSDHYEGERYCIKNIIPIINTLVKVPVSIATDGCKINPDTGECTFTIEETPKYHISSYSASRAKDGEEYIGDSYAFNKNDDGNYITIISDGMGSGPEARSESELTVELIEEFIENGFSEKTAINTVNSIMAMKFNEDEKFATMDLSIIDLYTGDAEFIKLGGIVSFVKRGEEVSVIKSNKLPFGILDSVDLGSEKVKLKHGDIIISMSDGILDVDKNNIGSYYWLEEYLRYADTNPSALAKDILDKAVSLSGGKVNDDMTVLVSKIYSVY